MRRAAGARERGLRRQSSSSSSPFRAGWDSFVSSSLLTPRETWAGGSDALRFTVAIELQ